MIGQILPLAVGIAISPVPIIAAILMLLSPRASGNGGGFLLGWIIGVVVVTAIMIALSGSLHTGGGPPPVWASWTKIILGVLLLVRGVGRWRGRGEVRDTPKWMKAIDDFTFGKSLGVGMLLSAVNPKNLILAVAAGLAIGTAGLPIGQEVVVVAVFTIIASSTVAIPVVGYLLAGQKMRPTLDRMKVWLQTNNAGMMAVLILILSAVLIGKGIEALAS